MAITQGEWKVNGTAFTRCSRGHGARTFVVDSELNQVAEVQGDTESECVGNARLIASAPDLLEACKGVMPDKHDKLAQPPFVGRYSIDGVALERIRLAIKKVEGK